MKNLGVKRGMVVYGQDSLDEISLARLDNLRVKGGGFALMCFVRRDFGLELCDKSALQGGIKPIMRALSKRFLAGGIRARNTTPPVLMPAQPCISPARHRYNNGYYLAPKLD